MQLFVVVLWCSKHSSTLVVGTLVTMVINNSTVVVLRYCMSVDVAMASDPPAQFLNVSM